jgi:ribosomal protein S18 acetylase RimI-like enzyme
MKTFIFRVATESDLRFMSKLSAEVFSEYGRYYEIVPVWFLEPGVMTEIIMEGEYLLGFAMLALERQQALEPRRGHLLAIAVSPEHRGRGAGRALLNHMEDLAGRYGISEMQLWTAHDNLQALSFFQKAGFEIIGSEGRYYPKGQPAFALSKKLGPWTDRRRH